MFYHLEGIIANLTPERAAVDCGGVGYDVLITPNTASSLTVGQKAKLYISESIGEDHFDLYGFLSTDEKFYFELLKTVSGIGPKAALSILSYNNTDAISAAIISSNENAFTACPGIGKKTAQRIILELKDKIAKGLDVAVNSANISPLSANGANAYEDALTALVSLGYNSGEVVSIIRQIDISGMTSDQIIKAVLRYMV